jgi:hypothetical protein
VGCFSEVCHEALTPFPNLSQTLALTAAILAEQINRVRVEV